MLRTKWTMTICVVLVQCLPSLAHPAPTGSEGAAEIPFKLYDGHIVIVKGTIGLLENVNIMLDTGKSPTAISEVVAKKLNLHGNPDSMLLSNGKIEVQSAVVPIIRIGPIAAEGVRVVVQDLGFMERHLGISISGIAGLDVLSTGRFLIDYGKKKISFGAISARRKSVYFEMQRPFLTVRVKIEGQDLRVLVDSGTSGLLLYSGRLQGRLDHLLGRQVSGISTAVGAMQTRLVRVRVALGNTDLGSKMIAIADVDPDPRYEFDGLIGFINLGFRKVWFDFEQGLIAWD